MEIANDFRIMMAINFSEFEIMRTLRQLEEFGQNQKNHFELGINEDYDPKKESDAEEGYMYYRYELYVCPVEDDVSLNSQIELAKKIKNLFESKGGKASILADFEIYL